MSRAEGVHAKSVAVCRGIRIVAHNRLLERLRTVAARHDAPNRTRLALILGIQIASAELSRFHLPRGSQEANEAAWRHLSALPGLAALWPAFNGQVALAGGDLIAARRWADDAVSVRRGWHLMVASMTRARVAITQREFEQAECDAHEALACAAVTGAPLFTPDVLECLAHLAGEDGSHREAARLFGAAEALRGRMGAVRIKTYDAGYEASVAALRNALGEDEFESA